MTTAGVLPFECRVPPGSPPVTITDRSLSIIAIKEMPQEKVRIDYSVDQKKFTQEDSTDSVLSTLWSLRK